MRLAATQIGKMFILDRDPHWLEVASVNLLSFTRTAFCDASRFLDEFELAITDLSTNCTRSWFITSLSSLNLWPTLSIGLISWILSSIGLQYCIRGEMASICIHTTRSHNPQSPTKPFCKMNAWLAFHYDVQIPLFQHSIFHFPLFMPLERKSERIGYNLCHPSSLNATSISIYIQYESDYRTTNTSHYLI